ncbi:ligase-associated DNA damage response endonuclease PdeM [Flavobacterium sp. NRK1]|uniref:ligase-associated DNA damage response endonuclease PdeM n=1 Tax=Flavobacterium sp. NRK1 TaxID=2954929 RepID=UPI0020934455|nr:ligase-associated DNA damage response endonuclease PdeM [Flavobacterium sp. NRK1]MCO6149228.1 ligase-associated DNA damage response endonuclease PdeM [Flavobacterium sp. NRK1]
MTLEIKINNQTFILHCSGALYWVERRMLLASDVHLGKISHFRKHGSALPENAIFSNFKKLNSVLEYFKPEVICFLGDLFHSTLNNEWTLFKQWTELTATPIILVAGNHDIISHHKYEELGITVVSELLVDKFLLTHHPENRDSFYTLSGHIHPSIVLAGKGRQFLKLPCFFRMPDQMILPAFGEFTGSYVMDPGQDDRVYVITKQDVIEVNLDNQR